MIQIVSTTDAKDLVPVVMLFQPPPKLRAFCKLLVRTSHYPNQGSECYWAQILYKPSYHLRQVCAVRLCN